MRHRGVGLYEQKRQMLVKIRGSAGTHIPRMLTANCICICIVAPKFNNWQTAAAAADDDDDDDEAAAPT
ncbi:hypothetical protein T4A_4908 [Trichinella pseudospiralis]|uniref:Uncharacterized protein n=1 Tax=Trichinella pseudospiralis TaxID=6337 RepID=A0A0V1E2T6_TRIPS|nr:hypothetical protein T4A_4908 [Trichinella pseudospiralis]